MISVCMATYNGEVFLKEQLDSILIQLTETDELVISDDGSTDQTRIILQEYQKRDSRIRLFDGPQKGLIANFSSAIEKSQGEVIFLADQDDVWLPNKVSVVQEFFKTHPAIDVVVSDLTIVDEKLNVVMPSYFSFRKAKTGFVKNIVKNSFIGAGIAFRSSLKEKILPIPASVPMHDMWIGLLGNTALINEPLTLYRRHQKNVSEIKTRASRCQQLKWRLALSWALLKRVFLRNKKN